MAEKEERIYLFTDKIICENCKDWYEHIDPLDKQDCDNCEDIADLPHISRQEAIEKMAKAICKETCACPYYVCGNCTEFLEHYYPDIAEAALNALLNNEK